MYDELVKRLRTCPDYNDGCTKCPHEHDLGCRSTTMREAADAIEELLMLKALADSKIERLESAKAKKKRPPKRFPCTCGRKQLDLWWSSNPSDKGWFLKCPNCGRQSQPERYKSHVNSVWNNGQPQPPKED